MNVSTAIKTLETECCTQISIEACHEAFADCEDLKLAPDQYLHHSAYCRERKLADHNQSCASNKKRSLEIASYGRSFCGMCPFGVREFAQPVIFKKKAGCCLLFYDSSGNGSAGNIEKKRTMADGIHSTDTFCL